MDQWEKDESVYDKDIPTETGYNQSNLKLSLKLRD